MKEEPGYIAILIDRIEEIKSKGLLREDVKIALFGEIGAAYSRNDINTYRVYELEKLIEFDRSKHKELVDIIFMGDIINR